MSLLPDKVVTGKFARVGYLPWLFLLLFTHAVMTFPVGLLINRPNNYSFDEQGWHYPNILLLAKKWPSMDWNQDMLSEIAPGYLYFLAGVSKITGTDIHTLRAVNIFISLSLLTMLYLTCLQRVNPRMACLLLMPLATSNYFIKTAAFLFTDKAGLFLATSALLLANREKLTMVNGTGAGLLAACATLSRQFHIWLAGPLLWRALEPFLGAWSVRYLPEKYHFTGASRQEPVELVTPRSIWHVVVMAGLPLAALLFLVWQWGGIVRAPWRTEVMTVSTTAWAYQLALIAMFAPFYIVPAVGIRSLLQERSTKLAMLVGAACGLVVAVVCPNAFDENAGHYGGVLWLAAQKLPVFYQRSLLFLLLSPAGGALLALTVCWLRARRGIVISLRWFSWVCAWASTYLVQKFVFQRYFSAPLLMFLILALAFGLDAKKYKPLAASLCVLTVIQLAFTVLGFYAKLPW